MSDDIQDKDLQKHFSGELAKLFSGRYEVTVTQEDDGTTLNFTELLRLIVKTTQNVCKKVIALEDMEHTKKPKTSE